MVYKIFIFLVFCNFALSEIPFRNSDVFLPKLNQRTDLTGLNGTINAFLIGKLNVGDVFYIKFLDGKDITCLITETNVFDTRNYYFGNDLNDKDNKFGFFIDSDNKVEGAIIFKNKKVIYKLVYNEELKCYYFLSEISL